MQHSLKVLPIAPALNTSGLIEPEDARITGLTRSLNRRVLALNMPQAVIRKTASSTPNTFVPQTRIA